MHLSGEHVQSESVSYLIIVSREISFAARFLRSFAVRFLQSFAVSYLFSQSGAIYSQSGDLQGVVEAHGLKFPEMEANISALSARVQNQEEVSARTWNDIISMIRSNMEEIRTAVAASAAAATSAAASAAIAAEASTSAASTSAAGRNEGFDEILKRLPAVQGV
ncbi:hypothetical protein POM88_033118 [Heracleum sosnowskyi]|uniref:Uncharacterized protein n=1 Tax=Heracleum sosnowskyi TaxID=360622 RepID=A0AAD8I1H5_9APIA|nr:hypothetical protein POM88_033118 [Heracleum sosnowskyi]